VQTIRIQGNKKMNKNLAYLIGVFLGDGSISNGTGGKTFSLQVIDKDFAENTVECLRKLSSNSVRIVEMNRRTVANKIVYAVYLSDVIFCNKLLEITNQRKNLPINFNSWEKEMQLELIAGLLDSEGYVSMTRFHIYNNRKVFDMKIGIGAIDIWIYELYQFLKEKGIKIGMITRENLKSGKVFAKFIFNKKSFIENGFYFKIFRKQQRIENYKILFPGSTTIRGIPKTEYTKQQMSKFAQTRERVGGKFVKVMI
jgi:DNA-binding transcriptional regulator WhiA